MTVHDRLLTALRCVEIQPFEVMEVMARAHALEAQGRRIIHMEIGEPDFTAPQPVLEAAARAMRDGLTSYTAALGLPALREAIAQHYAQRFGVAISPARIAVTAGASGGLLLAFALLVDPGNEVLVPDPGYPGYRHFVRAFEGRAVPVPVSVRTAFQPTPGEVAAAWSENCIALILGSPSNPTGTLIDPEELAGIAGFVGARDATLVVDEIYQGLSYAGDPTSALSLPGNLLVVNSFSKYFCMTGWRLGWVVLPEALVRPFEKLAQHLFICPSAIAQHAALAAFDPESTAVFEQRRAEFRRRRDLLVPSLESIGFAVPARPEGAFYVYADCTRFGGDAKRLSLDLLGRAGVAVTPGIDFGANDTARYMRFAYTRSYADLEEGMARLRAACAN
ncbi:MAG: pyridoxal phosphate-dependent aminotransferase [Betaproteobacteria bacterium]|nr:pyridoxal phosphate-dependent aminotransferase [Betaproteobacteria bacterium]